VSFRDGAGVLLWRRSEDRLVALAVSPAYVREKWQSRIDSIRSSQEVALELTDPEADGPSVKAFSRNQLPLDTGLPWRITVAPANPLEETAQSASRRHLLMGGLGLLLLVVAAGGYFVARSVKRELELARLQSDFVAAVSHEFRTPLTSLGQATELLVDGRITDPEQLKKYFEKQARATGRLRRLVESLLEWGRVEAGRTPYRMEKLDASDVVRAAVDEFRRDEPGGHAIEYSPADAAVVIHGDRDALIRALRNLLDNAVKYSPGCPTVWVQLRSLDGRAEISVKDSGLGIPRNEHRDIFRKFVRGAAAKAHAIKGTGVGLAMVKHIVECHGGEIHLESEPGAGSTFTIVL
jgi:signal transduction histidine kinase